MKRDRSCVRVCVGVLLVVSVGVALGVFVGGVLLVAAARYFKRFDELTAPRRARSVNGSSR